METLIIEIAQRIRELRELLNFSFEEMAEATGVTPEEYEKYERGENDFPFTFLMKCAEKFGVDIVELMTGENPRLSSYTIVRAGKGLPIERRKGLKYQHLAYLFKNKLVEPFLVSAPYSKEESDRPIVCSTHQGQEFDYILSGSLRVTIDGHEEILNAGDTIYYNSGKPHGMVAFGGGDCEFLAVVIKKAQDKKNGEDL